MSRKIYNWPEWAGIQEIYFQTKNTSKAASSPITPATRYNTPLHDKWQCSLILHSLPADEWRPLRAFLMGLDGSSGVVRLGDITTQVPRGKAAGLNIDTQGNETLWASGDSFADGRGWTGSGSWRATVLQDHSSKEKEILIGGLVPNELALMADDKFQIHHRLFTCIKDVRSDANGHALVEVRPRLHEKILSGSKVLFHKPKGLFRLTNSADLRIVSPIESSPLALEFEESV